MEVYVSFYFYFIFPLSKSSTYNKLDHKIVFYRVLQSCSSFTLQKNGYFIAFLMKVIIMRTTKNRDGTISKHYNMN